MHAFTKQSLKRKRDGISTCYLGTNLILSITTLHAWGTSHHVTDVGPYASITQHNNIMNKIYHVMPREKTCHVLHRLSLSVQSVYNYGVGQRGLPSKEDGEGWSERERSACNCNEGS